MVGQSGHRVARFGGVPRSRDCIYCGAVATSLEHAIPEWIPRYLGQQDYLIPQVQAKNVTRRKHVPFGDYKARILCHECNVERLGPREHAVRPLLTALLDGEAVALDAEEQRLLARWCAKTACNVMAVERKRRFVLKSHRRAVIANEDPPEEIFVGLGRYTASGVRIFAGRRRLTPGRGIATDPIINGYHVVLAFGQLVIKVFGVHNPQPGDVFRIPVGELTQVWPRRDDPARWPPLWGLDDRGIDRLFAFNPYIRR